jgi:hypothetical protein
MIMSGIRFSTGDYREEKIQCDAIDEEILGVSKSFGLTLKRTTRDFGAEALSTSEGQAFSENAVKVFRRRLVLV